MPSTPAPQETSSISPLLKSLAYTPEHVSASEIASAFSLVFENRLSVVQMAAFLALLHSTGKDRDPDVLAECSLQMRNAASVVDVKRIIAHPVPKQGSYQGGLCDIVGTGGDGHSTFNISTSASIIASAVLRIAKHGNRAQTSFSGSADVLEAIQPRGPRLDRVTAETLSEIYDKTNYAFLFAPNFHQGMRFAAPVRKQLGLRTIFNLLGPLANPVEGRALEARVVGVANQQLGPVFAEALRLSGVKKALVVCGREDLDEISCAGETQCWRLESAESESSTSAPAPAGAAEDEGSTSDEECNDVTKTKTKTKISHFTLHPTRDFGLPIHPLSTVGGGKRPAENAEILMQILRNERPRDDPILDFVLLNVAALLVVAGVAASWREGVEKGRWCIESGRALENLERFVELSWTVTV